MIIRVLFKEQPNKGSIKIVNAGYLAGISSEEAGFSFVAPDCFVFSCLAKKATSKAVLLDIEEAHIKPGHKKTILNIHFNDISFSLFLADVSKESPPYIPAFGCMVTTGEDKRTYREIEDFISAKKLQSRLAEIESEAEPSFETAQGEVREMKCPTWLGISRDVRIFEVDYNTVSNPSEPWNTITPKIHCRPVVLPEFGIEALRYDYFLGRGIGCENNLSRWLENGYMPILNTEIVDGGIAYKSKIFTSYEKRPLTRESLAGTRYMVSDSSSLQAVQTKEQSKITQGQKLLQEEEDNAEQTVLYMRVECVNLEATPRYCWMRIPQPNVCALPFLDENKYIYDKMNGFAAFDENNYYMVALLDGAPVPEIEMPVLIPAGGKCRFEFFIPHKPVDRRRIEALSRQNFDGRFAEACRFWQSKLENGAKFNLPDKRIENMMRAGLLHLDLICFGKEDEDAVAPAVGVYGPIGTESSPIIHYFEFAAQPELARRSIMYFLNKQHENGFINNYDSYMSETAFALANAVDHYRYTKDKAWLVSVKEKLIKGCDFLIKWSKKNKKEELRGKGYGMIDGKIADPKDPYHGFMLNAPIAYLLENFGLAMKEIGDLGFGRFLDYAREMRGYISDALVASIACAPLVPLADGSWAPAIGAWPDTIGAPSIYADSHLSFTHGSVNLKESLIGANYLFLYDALDPKSTIADFLIEVNTDVYCSHNVAFSQPYYNVQPYAHLRRGEAKAFQQEFYYGMASLSDRETYTFWEHYHQVSPHKTHEEAWFLMRCRWMLALEDNVCLRLLAGIPSSWLEDGQTIEVFDVVTLLGTVGFEVHSRLDKGYIDIALVWKRTACNIPEQILIRLAHPCGIKISGSNYGTIDESGQWLMLPASEESMQIKVVF